MKLIHCTNCGFVGNLVSDITRYCDCGRTAGSLKDNNATYSGEYAVPLAILDESLGNAIKRQPNKGRGRPFLAFVVTKICDRFVRSAETDDGVVLESETKESKPV